jgi:HEAT repeat protein
MGEASLPLGMMPDVTAERRAPRQSLAANLLLSLAVSLLLAGAVEGLARLVERGAPTAPRVADYIWDWERMWEGDFYTVGSAAVGWPPWEEFNRDGLRDRAHPEEKPARTLRLAFLGDSVTFGDGLRAEEAYPQALQRRLDAAGRRVEVFNMALQGWSTRQQRLAYERIARRYRPDRVIVAVCLNDIPELQNNLSRPPAWLLALHRRSALVRRVLDASGREIRSVEELFQRPDAPRVRQGFERFFAELRALRARVEADGADLGLLVFPFRFQLEPDAPEPSAQRRLMEFCRRERLVCVDLLPVLAAHGPSVFRDYDHLDGDGAEAVAAYLATSVFVPSLGYSNAALQAVLLDGVGAGERAARLSAIVADARADAERREVAAWALGRRGEASAAAAPALARALRADPDAGVRAAAARALGYIPGAVAPAAAALVGALGDAAQGVRWAAAQALAAQPLRAPDGAVARLVPVLSSRDPYVRGFAVWSLGELGAAAEPAVPALVAALRDEDDVPGVAAQALAKIGPAARAAVPALLEVLGRDDARRRWNAAGALGRIGPGARAATPALAAALRDGDARVRAQAALALGRIGAATEVVVPALAAALRDESEDVRAQAARALGRLGPGAIPAIARLNGALRDGDERVRKEARKALARIQSARSEEREGASDEE